jgi:NTP pyrophosphatase (non-canonical NTP hydrolase)
MEQKIIDTNVIKVVAQYAYRAQKGFDKYGTTTERTDVDLQGWLQHLQEELMDATVYIERIKHELKSKSDTGEAMPQVTQQQKQGPYNNMSVDEYLELTSKTAIYPEAGTGRDLELYYLSLGLVSEAGEVAGKVKKLIRDGKFNQGEVAYELGDVFWYLVRLCDAIGYSPSQILEININKLLKRKENGTLKGNGDNR